MAWGKETNIKGPTGAVGPMGPQGPPGGAGLEEAPIDGKYYARKDAAWAEHAVMTLADADARYVNISGDSMTGKLTINGNTGLPAIPDYQTYLHLVGADGAGPPSWNALTMDAFGSDAQVIVNGRLAGGTRAAKLGAPANYPMLNLVASGWDTTAYFIGATMGMMPAEVWTATKHGSKIIFGTTPLGSTAFASAVQIQPSGGMSIGPAAFAVDPGAGGLNTAGLVAVGASTVGWPLSVKAGTLGHIFGVFAGGGGGVAIGSINATFDAWQQITVNSPLAVGALLTANAMASSSWIAAGYGSTTGTVYFGTPGLPYLTYDGAQFIMNGGGLTVSALTANSGRLVSINGNNNPGVVVHNSNAGFGFFTATDNNFYLSTAYTDGTPAANLIRFGPDGTIGMFGGTLFANILSVASTATFTNNTNFNGATQFTYNTNIMQLAGTLDQPSGGSFMVQSAGGANDAFLTFHRAGAYAANFGLNGADWCVGGWSMGNIKYKIFHEGNPPRNIPMFNPGTNYRLVLGDAGKCITMGGVTLYIPAYAAVPYAPGTVLTFAAWGGNLTIANDAGNMYLAGTSTPGVRTLLNTGVATAIMISPDLWMIAGPGLS